MSGLRISSGGSAPANHHTTSRFARKSASKTPSSGDEFRLEYHQNQSLPSATISGCRTLFGMYRSEPHCSCAKRRVRSRALHARAWAGSPLQTRRLASIHEPV